MKKGWRFVLGAAMGVGLGYALVLLLQPGNRRSRRLRVIYQAPREERKEQPAG
jgi:hypothetical protein